MEDWLRDIRYAARSLSAAPRFSAIVILTLALGIGANTAVFSVLHAVVLQPLPYDDPDRLVRIYQTRAGQQEFLAGPVMTDMRESSRTLDIAALYTYRADGADLTDRPQPERVGLLPVSADYFRVMGVEPIAGRVFDRGDEREDARVAVVSERIWREYLGAAPDAPGRMLSLNGVAHRVTAVLPATFDDPLQPGVEIWTPVNLQPGDANSWDNNYLTAVARLRPGSTLEQAQAELSAIVARQQSNYPANSDRRVPLVLPLQTDIVGSSGRTLWMLLGAVSLLLLIACVNVASLFLARGAARQSEMAVRSALGCSRARLVRQLLVEAVMLSLAGGAAGLLLAQIVAQGLVAAAPETVARAGAGTFDAAVFAFSFAAALAAGLAFGVAPAAQFTRPELESALRESGRSGTGSRRQARARNVLVVCQISLALVLLVGAGLLLRTFQRLQSVDLGMKPAGVVTFDVHLPIGRYATGDVRARFHEEFHRRLSALPGVRAAAAVSRLPVTGTYHSWGTRRPDLPPERRSLQTEQRVIEGAYFDALQIPVIRGRVFGPGDHAGTPRRAVVSQEFVRQMFREEDPLGRTIRTGGQTMEIIGVVGDVPIAVRGRIAPTVYHSHRQFADNRNWALVQVVAPDGQGAAVLAQVRRELAAIDPALVLHQPRMLTDVIGRGIAQERFALLLVGAFALLALALAAVGIYGVLSFAVSRRRREIGIRMALGAQPGSVRGLVVGDGGRLALAGVGIGLAIAFGATRALGSLLFGVSATEPLVYAAAAVTVLGVAIAASWIPARTATKVEPLEVLSR